MSNLISRYDLFPSPVWHFEYPEFFKIQTEMTAHLLDDEKYFVARERNGLQTTEGNLHTHDEVLVPIRDFIQESFEHVMTMMGYEPKCGMTSMWATRQREGGFHHEHIHKNTFLAGVFYVYDHDKSASGTVFRNHNSNLYQIQPRLQKNAPEFLAKVAEVPFVSGTLVVFPAWMNHFTGPSDSSCRIIIGANAMPIGKPNADHYTQYDYPDPADIDFLSLEEHIKEGYIGR
jgi:hypothetical protein